MFEDCLTEILDYGYMELAFYQYHEDHQMWTPKDDMMSSEVWKNDKDYHFCLEAKDPSGRYSYMTFYVGFNLDTMKLKYNIQWEHGATEFEVPMEITEEQYFQLSVLNDMWVQRETLLRVEDYLMEFVHMH